MKQLGHSESARKPPPPRLETLPSTTADEVMDLYRTLGGVQSAPKLAPGTWDIAYDDGLLLELDEDLHFHRYRGMTLDAPWAIGLPWTRPYRTYVVEGERRAGTGGKRWTSPSAEKMFGTSDPDGSFEEHGAPRWKQRALYDAMKDAMAATGEIRLARVSIYDRVAGHTLNDVLYGRAEVPAESIEALVTGRTA